MSGSKIIIEKELGAIPSVAEMEVVDLLVINDIPNIRVLFLKPNQCKGIRTPDILIDSTPWEIKSPKSSGSRTIEHAIRSASRQSENIIIDIRHLPMDVTRAISQIKFHSLKRTNIKKLVVITVDGNIIDIK